MFAFIKQWFVKRKAAKIAAHEQAGYDYAWGVLTTHRDAADVLESLIDAAHRFGDYDSFDAGIERALMKHARGKLCNEPHSNGGTTS